VTQDPTRELRDLSAVHGFYIQLLERHLGHAIPVPAEVGSVTASKANLIDVLRRWLRLLDIAITAPMVRDALKEATSYDTSESLYRYYILKASPLDADRDKTDFLGTHILKHPGPNAARPAGVPRTRSDDTYSHMFSQNQADAFQKEIEQMLGQASLELAPEYTQLLREYQYLHQEADEFRHFDQIMDSGILQRVRDLKHKFADAFYHPRVLAASAVYNVFFGQRFDDLFHEAAAQIKAFAAKVEQDGGSIMSRVDGDVTVKNLTEVEESKILKADYGHAKEHFHKVSRFKKAVDSRRSGRAPGAMAAGAAYGTGQHHAPAQKPGPAAGLQPVSESPVKPGDGTNLIEDNKTKGIVESIRTFVRSGNSGNIVPVRGTNVALTPGELEAFKAEYTAEKSFRADYANSLAKMVALHTRMQQEMDDYRSKRSSSYLWKQHADSLTYLIAAGNRTVEEAGNLAVLAEQRGLGEKAKAISVTLEKLRGQINVAAKTLQN
jgi:hypothetical protein